MTPLADARVGTSASTLVKVKTTLPQENPSPKGGMEVGLLAIAVLLVLFFAATAIFPGEKGIKVNRIGCVLGFSTDGSGAELDRILVTSTGTILFRDCEFSDSEFETYLSKHQLEKNKVYKIHAHPRAEFGNIIKIHDLIRNNGISDDYVFIGGVSYSID